LHIFDARITAIAPATPSIRALRLAIPDTAFRFLPGQWVDLSVEIDGVTHTAGYSITTSPIQQGEIELAIKASARHPLARWVHECARPDDRVRVTQGQGPFVYLPEMSERECGADRRRRGRHPPAVDLPPRARCRLVNLRAHALQRVG